ncbi:hypothetical protein ACR6A7_03200 [Pantoea sp. RRHST58]|uniref:hypothetical protein n=1 Tax=Pantoea sp. RRHST58 TaxID=3425183 RepID=UPI003DA192E9
MEAPLHLKLARCKSFAQAVGGNIKISGDAYDDTAAFNKVSGRFKLERFKITTTAFIRFSVISNNVEMAVKSLPVQAAFLRIMMKALSAHNHDYVK